MSKAARKQIEAIRVVKMISWEEAEGENRIGWMGGWFDRGHRWEDYIVLYKEEARVYLEAARDYVIKTECKTTGDQHQHSGFGVPLFSDGTVMMLSYRAWGDFMAAVWSTEENEDYTYMTFYM